MDLSLLLGRLFDRVELINPVSNVCLFVRTYVYKFAKVSLISMKFGV